MSELANIFFDQAARVLSFGLFFNLHVWFFVALAWFLQKKNQLSQYALAISGFLAILHLFSVPIVYYRSGFSSFDINNIPPLEKDLPRVDIWDNWGVMEYFTASGATSPIFIISVLIFAIASKPYHSKAITITLKTLIFGYVLFCLVNQTNYEKMEFVIF